MLNKVQPFIDAEWKRWSFDEITVGVGDVVIWGWVASSYRTRKSQFTGEIFKVINITNTKGNYEAYIISVQHLYMIKLSYICDNARFKNFTWYRMTWGKPNPDWQILEYQKSATSFQQHSVEQEWDRIKDLKQNKSISV